MTKKSLKALGIFVGLICLLGLLFGCEGRDYKERRKRDFVDIKTIEHDGCEYIYDSSYSVGTSTPLTHKGICKNQRHEEEE